MRFKTYYNVQLISEGSGFKVLQKNKIPLSDDERKECMAKKAVWHFNGENNPCPAVWKSVDEDGTVTYVTNTHRAMASASTLKGAIGKYHNFIKGTA